MTLCTPLVLRELRSSFRSILSWGLLAAFIVLSNTALLFCMKTSHETSLSLPAVYTQALLLTLPLYVTLITMRSFTTEQHTGTLELLLTAPVQEFIIIKAKFITCFIETMVAIVLFIISASLSPVTALSFSHQQPLLVMSLAYIILHAVVWIYFGIFASLVCPYPALAAILTLCLCIPHSYLAAGMILFFQPSGYWSALSIVNAIQSGTLDSRPILLCVTVMMLMFFISIRQLESRRWVQHT